MCFRALSIGVFEVLPFDLARNHKVVSVERHFDFLFGRAGQFGVDLQSGRRLAYIYARR